MAEAIVRNAGELRTAVSTDNGIDYVYLAENITLDAGITISPAKPSLVIDGEYPPASGIFHQFTDIDWQFESYTMGVRASSTINITLRNMTINGLNYFGVPYIAPNSGTLDTSGVTVNYENVTYTGPQMTYHRFGTTRYTDCTITIQKTSSAAAEEVGEVKNVFIGGQTTILHNSTTGTLSRPAVFWFRNQNAPSTLTILSGADVQITSTSNYFMFNLDGTFTDVLVPVQYVIETGASLRLTANMGISYATTHLVNAFSLAENAYFHYTQTQNNGNVASLYMNGELNVGLTARFIMEAASATQPLISFTNNAACRLTLADPLSFVLYNANAAVLGTAAQTPFSLNGGQLNIWTTARVPLTSAGGFDDIPQHKWNKQAYQSNVEFTGTFTNAVTTLASHNITAEDAGYNELTQLILGTARVISLGNIRNLANPVVDDGRPITGITEPSAFVRVEYYAPEDVFHELPGSAGDNGRYSIETTLEDPSNVPAGTEVAIWLNTPFLIKQNTIVAIVEGEFTILSAPVQIVFNTPTIVIGTDVFLQRYYPEDDEPVVVYDSRADSTEWELSVSIHEHLTTETGESLPNALVFRPSDPDASLLVLNSEPIVVHVGPDNGGEPETYRITWPFNEGILVRVNQPIRCGVKYSSHLFWDLRIIPPEVVVEEDEPDDGG